jgi:hypothetical protein
MPALFAVFFVPEPETDPSLNRFRTVMISGPEPSERESVQDSSTDRLIFKRSIWLPVGIGPSYPRFAGELRRTLLGSAI